MMFSNFKDGTSGAPLMRQLYYALRSILVWLSLVNNYKIY